MITRLRVKNYLSLQDVDIEFGPRNNVLVGPNMSGKSNLIDCFKFLTHMVQSGVVRALLDRGGFSEVVWKGSDENQCSLQLSAKVGGNPEKVYDYTIAILGSARGVISVEREHLSVRTGNEVATLIDLSHGQGQITHPDGTIAFAPPGPAHSALEFSVPGWEGTEVKNFIAAWRFYRLLPDRMKQVNEANSQNFLNENGDNLSSWLLTLQTGYPEEFRLLQQAAVDVFPDLEALLTPLTQFATAITSREKHLKRPVPIWRMSDGEVSFLAWLSLLFAPPALGAPLYCVEELENHLHPRLLETLVELLAQRQDELQRQSEVAVQPAQILMTTHSPYLVDRLTLDDLIVVDKYQGATRCTRPASKRHLRELLQREELGLGELWYAGALSEKAC